MNVDIPESLIKSEKVKHQSVMDCFPEWVDRDTHALKCKMQAFLDVLERSAIAYGVHPTP